MTYKTNPEKELEKHEALTKIKNKFDLLSPHLNERSQRLFAATEAKSLGRNGVSWVSEATGIARSTITNGCRQLESGETIPDEMVRLEGGGRKKIGEKYPDIYTTLEALLADDTSDDPEKPLRWTNKSVRRLAEELNAEGYEISYRTVGHLLGDLGYSLQENRQALGEGHVDREKQYRFITELIHHFTDTANPVVSVDCKKKENIGNFKTKGKTYRKKGDPVLVNTYDFIDKELGKANPYGVYDLQKIPVSSTSASATTLASSPSRASGDSGKN